MEKARGKGLEESVTGRAGPLQRAINNLHPLSFHAYCTCTGTVLQATRCMQSLAVALA